MTRPPLVYTFSVASVPPEPYRPNPPDHFKGVVPRWVWIVAYILVTALGILAIYLSR